MAARRLSELLEEQQEPFLLHGCGETTCCSVAEETRRRICVYGSNNGDVTGRSAVRRALKRALRRWDDLAGCFRCAARESFRSLQRAGDTGGRNCGGVVTEFEDHGDGSWRRLSPVSVLDVLRYYSDEESSSPTLRYWEQQEEDDQPLSKSGSSPPSGPLAADDTTHASVAEAPTTTTSGKKSVEEQQMIIASWERIAGDIARVPALAELDLSSTGSAPEWQRRLGLGLGEAARVGASIEAMIFDEVRAEAVRDMLSLTA